MTRNNDALTYVDRVVGSSVRVLQDHHGPNRMMACLVTRSISTISPISFHARLSQDLANGAVSSQQAEEGLTGFSDVVDLWMATEQHPFRNARNRARLRTHQQPTPNDHACTLCWTV